MDFKILFIFIKENKIVFVLLTMKRCSPHLLYFIAKTMAGNRAARILARMQAETIYQYLPLLP